MASSKNGISPIEQEVIAQIRALRASPNMEMHQALIDHPESIMFHVLFTSRGHVALRIAPIARELGAGMKKMQRSFRKKYKMSMLECQLKARLDFSKYLLQIHPTEKIAAIATTIGYNEVRDFNHFFHNQTSQTPTEWMRNERERMDDTAVRHDEAK